MDKYSLEQDSSNSNECNICYDNSVASNQIINLSCCNNSKQICVKCINCLTTPLCPYCRKHLDDKCLPFLKEENNLSRSEPNTNYYNINLYQGTYSFEEFLSEEHIINPYLYENSRRLRRQIRRLRHEYNQRRSEMYQTNDIFTRNQSSRYNRNQQRRNIRHHLNNEARIMTRLYNNTDISLENELMFHIETDNLQGY